MLGVGSAGPLASLGGLPPLRVVGDPRRLSEREAWAILASARQVGPVALVRIVDALGTASRAVEVAASLGGDALIEAMATAVRTRTTALSREQAAAVAARAAAPDVVLSAIDRLGLRILLLEDGDYPPRLLAIELPPPVLFVRGDVDALDPVHAVAVVGTRHPSEAGRALAARIATAISDRGATIVSGLALGIDGVAHDAAVRLRRPTVAVLGGGHDRIYPPAHRSLADAILEHGGAVISEHAPDETPTKGTFPRRNRLISGLAEATVVVEAPKRSGALVTAEWALDQGRECFLVPGAIGQRASVGCLEFLRQYPGQARVVASVESLLEDLELDGSAPRTGREPVQLSSLGLSSMESRLAELLRADAATVDDLVRETRLPVASVLSALTLLETRGLVAGAYGRYRPTTDLAGADLPRGPTRSSARR